MFLSETVSTGIPFATGFKEHGHLVVDNSLYNLHNKACEAIGTIVTIGECLSLFLCIGVTFAIVQSLGRMPIAIDLLNS